MVPSIKDTVETLEECLTVDKVETLAGRGFEVVHDRVDRTRRSADVRVERAWPYLAVGGQFKRGLKGAT